MSIEALKALIDTEPANAARTDAEVLDWLNESVQTIIESMTGDEVFGVTDSGEFGALTDAKRQMWLAFCGRSEIDPSRAANVAFAQWVFGGGSTTLATLNTARTRTVSRWSTAMSEMDTASKLYWIALARAA